LIEVLDDGSVAVDAVVEGVGPLTGVTGERERAVGAGLRPLDGPGGGGVGIDVCGGEDACGG